MTAGDRVQSDRIPEPAPVADGETQADAEWIAEDRHRNGPDTDDSGSTDQTSRGGDNEDDTFGPVGSETAQNNTGVDAMSKFGHAIGALADIDDDLDEGPQPALYSEKRTKPSRDAAVAPYIAQAEKELERSRSGKSGGGLDIFDRIAMAAESEFDGSRGSAAKRVSELVDDRRVGTKRWTPSKTMKQRMAQLEAARASAKTKQDDAPEAAATPVEQPVEAEATVTPIAAAVETAAAPKPEPAPEPAPMKDEQEIRISRKDRDPEPTPETAADMNAAVMPDAAEDEDHEEDADGLRVVPGARGRRRDRARRSRLDEDFEKIFDDGGKPSIYSLRRKMRNHGEGEGEGAAETGTEAPTAAAAPAARTSAPAAAPRAAAAGGVSGFLGRLMGRNKAEAPQTVAEAADPQPAPGKGLFSRMRSADRAKGAADGTGDVETEELVAAFEADSAPLTDDIDVAAGEALKDDDWELALENERKQRRVAVPIIASGAIVAVFGIVYFIARHFALI